MSDFEGPPKPRPELQPLSPEQAGQLADEALLRMKGRLESRLALDIPAGEESVVPLIPDAAVPGIPPVAAEPVVDPVVAAAALAVGSLEPASDVQGSGKNISGRRAKGRAAQKSVALHSDSDVVPSLEKTEKENFEKVMTSLEEGRKANLSVVPSFNSIADLEETHRIYLLGDRRFIVTSAESDIVTYGIQSKEYKKRILEKAAEYEQEIESAYNDKKRALEEVIKKNEKEPIVTGRYRDQEGILCNVREEGGKYFYIPLEGPDKGQELPQGDVGNMRALMGGEWMKVDDTTEPTSESAPVVSAALPATPDTTTPAPEPALAAAPLSAPDAAAQAPLSRRDQQKAERESKRAEALRKLLEQLGGQTEFVLVNPKTKAKTECQIDASGVITKKGESADQTSWVIEKLTLVSPWEVKVKKGSTSIPDAKTPADPVVPPAVPDVAPVASASPDTPASIEKKETIRLPEKDGEVFFYSTPNGRIAIQLVGINVYAYAAVDPDFNPRTKKVGELLQSLAISSDRSQEEILAMAKEQGWKQVPVSAEPAPVTPLATPDTTTLAPEPAVVAAAIPVPDAATQAPLSRREQQRAEKEAKRAEALRRLLEQLGGQTEFVLVSPKGTKTVCQIDASGVITKKGESANQTSWVIDKLTLVTPWEVKIKKAKAATPDTSASAEPKAEEDKSLEQHGLRVGEVWVREKSGVTVRVTIEEFRKKDGIDGVAIESDRIDKQGHHAIGYPMKSVLPITSVIDLLKGRFERETGDHTTEKAEAGSIDDDTIWVPTEPMLTLTEEVSGMEKREEDYAELFRGDMWVRRDVAGNVVGGLYIHGFFVAGEHWANVEITGPKLKLSGDAKLKKGDDSEHLNPQPEYSVEELRRKLKDEGYARLTRGTVSEKKTPDREFAKEKEFKVLSVGEKAHYQIPSRGEATVVEKTEAGYTFTYQDGTISVPLATAEIMKMAESEGWKFSSKEERPPRESLLAVGETIRYFVPELQAEYTVERTPSGYHFFSDTYISDVYTEEQMRETIRTAKWRLVEGSKQEASAVKNAPEKKEEPEKKEAPVTPETSKAKEPEEAEKKKEHMDGLLTEVKEARFAYVTTDYNQNSVWQKIKGIFGKNVSEHRGDVDTESAKGRYELALMKLQDAQLGELKTLGLPEEVLRKRMGEMLNYYKLDERISLYNDRNQVKMESMNGFQKLVTLAERVGREYNKLPRGAKYTLGGVCLAGGLLTGGGVIGGGVAAATSGLILMKRLIATTGLAVTVDTGIEQWMEKKRSGAAEKEREAHLKILDTNKEEGKYDFELMSDFLKKDIRSLDEKFKAQKKEALVRRSAVWGTAVAGMVGIGVSWASHLNAGVGSGSHTDRVKGLLHNRQPEAATAPASAASVAERTASAAAVDTNNGPSSTSLDRFRPAPSDVHPPLSSEIGHHPTPDEIHPPVPGAGVSPEVSARLLTLREDYTVTAADGKKGLWGIFERQLPADMPKGERNVVIARLEGTLQAKLHGMSPAQLKEVGFRTENMNKIYPGDKLALGKLLTSEEVRSAFESHGVSNGVTEGVHEAARSAAHQAVEGTQQVAHHVAADTVQTAVSGVAETDHGIPVSPLDHALNENTITRLADQPMVSPNPVAVQQAILEDRVRVPVATTLETSAPLRPVSMPEVVSPQDFANLARLGQFMAEHPELTPSYQNTLRSMKTAIFSMPQDMNRLPYIEQIDGGMTFDMQRANMARVLETFRDLRSGVMSEYDYNRQHFPFHSSQIERLTHLVRASAHPKIFGELGMVRDGETVNQYVERIAKLATALHKERELAYLVMKR